MFGGCFEVALQRRPGVTSEIVDGQAVLIPPSGQDIITLNAIGTLVWTALDTPLDRESLVRRLLDQVTGVEADELSRDVDKFLRELQDNDLIEGFPET